MIECRTLRAGIGSTSCCSVHNPNIIQHKTDAMKKFIFPLVFLVATPSAVFVYANASHSKPAREYVECRPASSPINTTENTTESTPFTVSLLVL